MCYLNITSYFTTTDRVNNRTHFKITLHINFNFNFKKEALMFEKSIFIDTISKNNFHVYLPIHGYDKSIAKKVIYCLIFLELDRNVTTFVFLSFLLLAIPQKSYE